MCFNCIINYDNYICHLSVNQTFKEDVPISIT